MEIERMAHEDRHVFAAWAPNMASAVMALNETGAAHLMQHLVPAEQGGYWMVFSDDSWVKQKWAERFPDALTLPRI
jgi:hypothetical protein